MSQLFDPSDLYPLIDMSKVPYEAQKDHARQVDAHLGFEIEVVESRIERGQTDRETVRQQWIGLPTQSLLTPYTEFRYMLGQLHKVAPISDSSTIVDIGAGYGRLGFVLEAHFPQARFTGIEISEPRVAEGKRVMKAQGLTRSELIAADILEMDLPDASVFFTYDFGPPRSIQELFVKFKIAAKQRPLTIVGRGRSTRDQIERQYPWLTDIVEPKHLGQFSIYRTAE
ncbi:MAG: class I SAM-dependent methyltransferase [Bdellovibrionales bacterium]|nr:class I SAM-dependent methyltransferase [Bdellovibrionales bacterium]